MSDVENRNDSTTDNVVEQQSSEFKNKSSDFIEQEEESIQDAGISRDDLKMIEEEEIFNEEETELFDAMFNENITEMMPAEVIEEEEVVDEVESKQEVEVGIFFEPKQTIRAKSRTHSEIWAEIGVTKQISGDFQKLTYPLKPIKLDIIEEKPIEEERTFLTDLTGLDIPVSEIKHKLMRICLELQKQKIEAKNRNSLLQNEIAKYFRRKRMDHCLKEYVHDAMHVYSKLLVKLDEYDALVKHRLSQQRIMEGQIAKLQEVRKKKEEVIDAMFNDFQNLKASVGRGLVFIKSGKTLSDKAIETIIGQHRYLTYGLAELRRKFISFKRKVSEREDLISNLDKVGHTNRTLQEYEKLKIENRSWSDRVEEKEGELSIERKNLQDTVQILSHVREKSYALNDDLNTLKSQQQEVQDEVLYYRRCLNGIKADRDNLRTVNLTLKNNAGLLFQPTLLRDFEKDKEEYDFLKKQLNDLKNDCKMVIKSTRNARQTLENLYTKYEKKIKKKQKKSASAKKVKEYTPIQIIPLRKDEPAGLQPSVTKLNI